MRTKGESQSRDVDATKADDLAAAADALLKVVHGQRHAAIVTETQASAWPHDDSTWGALADNALRTVGSESSGTGRPGCVGAGMGRRVRRRLTGRGSAS